ncbi:ubiquitin-conjugating enzyme/RWD-like protein [Lipomyces starkeyi]
MLKIWSMKQQQQQQQKEAAASGDGSVKKKVTAAQIRVQKDLTELSLPSTMKTHFPNPDDLLHFNVAIEPDEGMYQGGKFNFSFTINNSFPHEPPKVKCTQKIYHPNIDLEGNVCLNILREDWKPVLNLNAVLVGLQYLFLEPNAADPLNKEAASDLQRNRENFRRNVRNSMNGGYVGHEKFERVVNA